jgi:hypothetical protein
MMHALLQLAHMLHMLCHIPPPACPPLNLLRAPTPESDIEAQEAERALLKLWADEVRKGATAFDVVDQFLASCTPHINTLRGYRDGNKLAAHMPNKVGAVSRQD